MLVKYFIIMGGDGLGWGNFVKFNLRFFFIFLIELYEYCIKEGYVDKNFIVKWKK